VLDVAPLVAPARGVNHSAEREKVPLQRLSGAKAFEIILIQEQRRGN